MAERFVINGGKKLEGEIEARGAKNAAFPLLAASLLTSKKCVIGNVPLIEDVFRMVEILKSVGAEVSWTGEREVTVRAAEIDSLKIDDKLVKRLRGSVLVLGSLLARCGKARLPRPGGCVIGVRPIDTHLNAFSQLGVDISYEGDHYGFKAGKTAESAVILDEFSVTGTENMMLFAALQPQKTVIRAADADYQVQELAAFLRKMGVGVKIYPDRTITVEGKNKLDGVEHKLMYDPIEAGTFILTAAAVPGNVTVKNVALDYLGLFLKKLRDAGLPLEITAKQKMRGTVSISPCKTMRIDKIQSLPYPGIHSDLLSAFGVLATQTAGSTLIHDPLYEGRLKYLGELNKMGADIIFCDPHRAIINGPSQLIGQELDSTDLRGGAALIIAGLAAKGQTTISNIYQIDRGYEKIEERLRGIGADIQRVQN